MKADAWQLLRAAVAGALHQGEGRFGPAAAKLADRFDYDAELRTAAALAPLAFLSEPGVSAFRRTFEVDTGGTLEDFIARHTAGLGADAPHNPQTREER